MTGTAIDQKTAQLELTRRSLLRFTTHTKPNYRINFHHRTIAQAIEAVARYEIPKLIIVAPPRQGKSELTTRRLPAWYLGNNPNRQVITATYGQDLSDRMSLDVQRIMESSEYRELFPWVRFGKRKRTDEFHLSDGGTFKATATGGSVTGFGANLMVIDDPMKGREQAESQTFRDRAWEWFLDDMLTRLEQPSAVVVMATRWHQDDLLGRILASATADDWVYLHLPRIKDGDPTAADPRPHGAPLWPGRFMLPWEVCPAEKHWPQGAAEAVARFTEESEEAERILSLQFQESKAKAFDPTEYAGGDFLFEDSVQTETVDLNQLVARDLKHYYTYQQNNPYGCSALEDGSPTPRTGQLVDRDDINIYTGTPRERALHCDQIVISVDANFKKTATSDFAAMLVLGRTTIPNAIYLLDEVVGRFTYPQLKQRLKALVADWPRATILIEAKANGQALIDELRESNISRVIGFDPKDSKDSRAQVAAEFVAGGGLFAPTNSNAPWIGPCLAEICSYGQTAHDDRMDALSQAVIYYDSKRTGLSHLRRVCGLTDLG